MSTSVARLEDKEHLPYFSAVLHEAFRVASFGFLAIPHCTTEAVDLEGFRLPKDTTVLSNLYHIMHNPEYWTMADKFMPERFIDGDGKFKPDERVVPFGLGRRYCLGQTLAEKEYFLFFAGLMQRFRFKPAKGKELPGYGLNDSAPPASVRTVPQFYVEIEKRI